MQHGQPLICVGSSSSSIESYPPARAHMCVQRFLNVSEIDGSILLTCNTGRAELCIETRRCLTDSRLINFVAIRVFEEARGIELEVVVCKRHWLTALAATTGPEWRRWWWLFVREDTCPGT